MGRLVVGEFGWADRRPPRSAVHLRSPWLFIYFFGGCGLSFMGCNGLMLVGYDGGCGLILGFG